MLKYADHHIFNMDDLKEIKKHFEKITSANKLILTTEKDGVRLEKFRDELQDYPIYILPISHRFLFEEQAEFDKLVHRFVQSFNTVQGNK